MDHLFDELPDEYFEPTLKERCDRQEKELEEIFKLLNSLESRIEQLEEDALDLQKELDDKEGLKDAN